MSYKSIFGLGLAMFYDDLLGDLLTKLCSGFELGYPRKMLDILLTRLMSITLV